MLEHRTEDCEVFTCKIQSHIESASVQIKFPCTFEVQWRSLNGKILLAATKKQVKSVRETAHFDQTVSFQTDLLFNKKQHKFIKKECIIMLNLISKKRPDQHKLVGRITVDLADIVNEDKYFYAKSYKLDYCSVNGSLYFSAKMTEKKASATFAEKYDQDSFNDYNSLVHISPQRVRSHSVHHEISKPPSYHHQELVSLRSDQARRGLQASNQSIEKPHIKIIEQDQSFQGKFINEALYSSTSDQQKKIKTNVNESIERSYAENSIRSANQQKRIWLEEKRILNEQISRERIQIMKQKEQNQTLEKKVYEGELKLAHIDGKIENQRRQMMIIQKQKDLEIRELRGIVDRLKRQKKNSEDEMANLKRTEIQQINKRWESLYHVSLEEKKFIQANHSKLREEFEIFKREKQAIISEKNNKINEEQANRSQLSQKIESLFKQNETVKKLNISLKQQVEAVSKEQLDNVTKQLQNQRKLRQKQNISFVQVQEQKNSYFKKIETLEKTIQELNNLVQELTQKLKNEEQAQQKLVEAAKIEEKKQEKPRQTIQRKQTIKENEKLLFEIQELKKREEQTANKILAIENEKKNIENNYIQLEAEMNLMIAQKISQKEKQIQQRKKELSPSSEQKKPLQRDQIIIQTIPEEQKNLLFKQKQFENVNQERENNDQKLNEIIGMETRIAELEKKICEIKSISEQEKQNYETVINQYEQRIKMKQQDILNVIKNKTDLKLSEQKISTDYKNDIEVLQKQNKEYSEELSLIRKQNEELREKMQKMNFSLENQKIQSNNISQSHQSPSLKKSLSQEFIKEIDFLKEQLANLEQQNIFIRSASEQDLQRQVKQIENLQSALKAKQNQLNQVQNQEKPKKQDFDILQKKINEKDERIFQLEGLLEKKEHLMSEEPEQMIEVRIMNVHSEESSNIDKKPTQENYNYTIEQQKSSPSNEDQQIFKMQMKENQLENLEKQLKDANVIIEQRGQMINQYDQKLRSATADLSTINGEIKIVKRELTDKNIEIEQLKNEKDILEEKCKTNFEELLQSEQKILQAQDSLTDHKQIIVELEERIKAFKKKEDQINQNMHILDEQSKTFLDEILKKNDLIDQLKEDLVSKESQISTFMNEIDKISKAISQSENRYQAEIEDQDKAIERHENQAEFLRNQLHETNEQLITSKKLILTLQQENHEKSQVYQESLKNSQERKRLTDRIFHLEKILTISQENEKAKDIIIESLKKQEEALLGNKETLKEAIKEIDDRKNEINQLKGKIVNYQEMLEERTMEIGLVHELLKQEKQKKQEKNRELEKKMQQVQSLEAWIKEKQSSQQIYNNYVDIQSELAFCEEDLKLKTHKCEELEMERLKLERQNHHHLKAIEDLIAQTHYLESQLNHLKKQQNMSISEIEPKAEDQRYGILLAKISELEDENIYLARRLKEKNLIMEQVRHISMELTKFKAFILKSRLDFTQRTQLLEALKFFEDAIKQLIILCEEHEQSEEEI